jgi:hypothetical protein
MRRSVVCVWWNDALVFNALARMCLRQMCVWRAYLYVAREVALREELRQREEAADCALLTSRLIVSVPWYFIASHSA